MRLNLGCGTEEILTGYINVDIRSFNDTVIIDNIIYLSKFNDNFADEIRASHCIEHLPVNLIDIALSNWFRVLKSGGRLFIYCPDGRLIAQDLVGGIINIEQFSYYLFGAQTYDENLHRLAFDYDRLKGVCELAGFKVLGPAKRPHCYRYELGAECLKN